ncbi:hypothetical protein, partial [uncultured Paraglaciecola sp.]|uniref:hypothetical protein n=1 Tax=uncultured Paraglaciecola sp. TaxID=1765024 RepID=UPI00262119EA
MCAFVLFSSLFSLTASAAEAGDVLDSAASVHYFYNGLSYSKSDNAPFVVESAADSAPGAPGTSSAIDIWGPVSAPNSDKNSNLTQSECRIGNGTTSTTQLTYANGNPLNLPASIPSQQSDVFKAGSPLIVRVIDLDENLDNNQIDTVTVTINSTNPVESKELVLHETTNDSGEFIGIIQTTATETVSTNSCDLALTPESQVSINYQDSQDAEDSQSKTLSFDPYSRVFNAYTGELIDGITVRLIDNSNGLPATVYGDDGTSTFPNTIVSGGQAQDSSGKSYNFPTGGYRFPYIENGDYRIEVDTSIAYIFPSETDDQVIQTLPTAPYRLNNASRGFAASSQNLLLNVDIPLDPQSDRILLDKSSTLTTAGIGDFVPFEISMTNIEYDVSNIKLIDTLPVGLSYVEGSLRVNKAAYSDVLVSNNGQQITVNFPSLLSQEIVSISYISQVSATASGTMTNVAEISHPILKSNIATASIDFRDDLMRDKAQVIGRVILDDCDGNLDAEGLAGIRILMEDGRYVVSDQEGQWHFEGIKPGSHVIQLDVATLPPYLELSTCDNEFFHAGQSYSQFIDVQPGTLWRADFHVQPKMPDNGDVKQTLLNELMPLSEEERLAEYKTPVDKKIIYTANIGGTGV